MKRILMYTNDKIYTTKRMTGGIKRFKMLYEGLIKLDYNVTLYCGESEDDLKKYNKSARSVNRENNRTRLFAGIGIFLKNRKLIKNIKKEQYDEVIVFDIPTAIGLCLCSVKNINLFLRQDLIEYRKVLLNEKNKGKCYTSLYLKIMSLCEYICLKKAKKIIVQCQYDLNNLVKRHKHISKKIAKKAYVQINNVNAPWIVEKSKKSIEKRIDSDMKFSIGFIGDFSSTRKGHDIFLPVIKKLLDEKYNIKAYVIGDGKLLESERTKYNNDSIIFLGRMNNPIDIIKQVDLIVVPSKADSCPNTVLESLYNNTLVIGSNRGGIPEILNNPLMLFNLDIDSLEEKIKEVYNDKNKYNDLCKFENKRCHELCFDWVEKIIELIFSGGSEK